MQLPRWQLLHINQWRSDQASRLRAGILGQIARVEPLDLNVLIQDLLKMLRRILVENVALEYHPVPAPALLEADAGMLEQVVPEMRCPKAVG